MKANILIVDDARLNREIFKLALLHDGYRFYEAENGQQAREMVGRHQIDLILLDLMMPDVDGWDLFQQFKSNEITKNIPIIIITAKSQPIDRVLGLYIAKVEDYISKPFHPQELLASIERVLSSPTPADYTD